MDQQKTAEPTLLADKGYDSLRFRRFVSEPGFRPLIPARRCITSEQVAGELYVTDTVLQRKRYVVERTLGWLKGFRASTSCSRAMKRCAGALRGALAVRWLRSETVATRLGRSQRRGALPCGR